MESLILLLFSTNNNLERLQEVRVKASLSSRETLEFKGKSNKKKYKNEGYKTKVLLNLSIP